MKGVACRASCCAACVAACHPRSQDDATTAGASAAEASKEKLDWKDVFELTEWFRPGTIKRAADFDPTKM